jgi:hypothetical protein
MIQDAEQKFAISSQGDTFPGVYLPGQTSLSLKKYGLSFWDLSVVTFAEKAGLVHTKGDKVWAKLTDEGREMLERYAA